MRSKAGDTTRIMKHGNNPAGTGRILSFDSDMGQFQIEWINPEEKRGQQEEIAYC